MAHLRREERLPVRKAFVTGASGFVGARVIRRLLADGCDVAVLATPNDPMRRFDDLVGDIRVWRGDLASPASYRPPLVAWKPDVCIHCAWYAEPGKYLADEKNLACLVQSWDLLREVAAAGCKTAVFVGSCAEYDLSHGFLRVDSPTRPDTIYGASKLSLALIGAELAKQLDMQFIWARLFYLYGPGEDERRMVPAVIRALSAEKTFAATSGEQVRDYLHVDDVAAALSALAHSGAPGTYNVCSGLPITVRCLMETIGGLLSRTQLIEFGKIPYRGWEPPFICGDPQRLQALGWRPQIPLRYGLRQTISWWTERDTR
jgi:nucleoside-diphosphate-sugar epimerase